MSMIALALMLAITVEGVVEISKSIGRAVLNHSYKTAITQVVALAIGCGLCLGRRGGYLQRVGDPLRGPTARHDSDRRAGQPRL